MPSLERAAALDALGAIIPAAIGQGQLREAERVLDIAGELAALGELPPRAQAGLLIQQGRYLTVAGFLRHSGSERPIPALREAVRIARELGDQSLLAEALALLGQAHYFDTLIASLRTSGVPDSPGDTTRYAEALDFQQQALALREALGDTRGMSESLFQIGTVYERWQQYEPALARYRQARQLAEQHGHLAEQAEPARHFAWHALRAGQLDQALDFARQALAIREAAVYVPYLPFDHTLLSMIYQRRGELDQALQHGQRAVELAMQIGAPRTIAMSLQTLAAAQLALHEHDQARATLAQALDLLDEPAPALLTARLREQLGQLERAR